MRNHRVIVLCAFLAAWSPARAEETIPGPIRAEVTKVHDGDSFRVRARIWLDQTIDIWVRLRGVDTPELYGRCENERLMARQAREFVRFVEGEFVMLRRIGRDKYGQRVVADIEAGGKDLGQLLLDRNLGRAYGGGKKASWCG